jgi:hypothetical protein
MLILTYSLCIENAENGLDVLLYRTAGNFKIFHLIF